MTSIGDPSERAPQQRILEMISDSIISIALSSFADGNQSQGIAATISKTLDRLDSMTCKGGDHHGHGASLEPLVPSDLFYTELSSFSERLCRVRIAHPVDS